MQHLSNCFNYTVHLNVAIDGKRNTNEQPNPIYFTFTPQRYSVMESERTQRKSNNVNTAGAPVQLFN